VDALKDAGAEVVVCDGDSSARVHAALAELGRRDLTSLLLEGGPTLAGSFLDAGEIDELRLFIAPLVLGGTGARPLIAGAGAGSVGDAIPALSVEWERSGEDLLVRARLREW
jgi:diaminohydroxyphosphoribosylaminopyrimidine deaminase / 5-amino-6-(5-phosphoribosylamino)uracil reductase